MLSQIRHHYSCLNDSNDEFDNVTIILCPFSDRALKQELELKSTDCVVIAKKSNFIVSDLCGRLKRLTIKMTVVHS